MNLTKIDVAEAHLKTAVRLLFQGGHPASVYHLANAGREIIATLGEKTGKGNFLRRIAQDDDEYRRNISSASRFAGFFKHADRYPDAVLQDFKDEDCDTILLIACTDFRVVTGGMPVEAQVFEAWFFAQVERVSDMPLRRQELVRRCIRMFPGIRVASRLDRKRMGLEALDRAMDDPRLQMHIERTVRLA